MTKKTAQITTHVTDDTKLQAEAVAQLQGFASLSEYLNYLLGADIEKQREAMDKLAPIFGYSKSSDGSDGSDSTQFMRVMQEVSALEGACTHH